MSGPALVTASGPEGVRAVRSRAGLLRDPVAAAAAITGADRVAFLQNQLPLDVAALEPGRAAYTASLDRKGRITHDLTLMAGEDRHWVLLEPALLGSFLAKLEEYRFRERVAFEDLTPGTVVLELHGPSVPALLARAAGRRLLTDPLRHQELDLGAVAARFLSDPWTGDAGGRILVPRSGIEAAAGALAEAAAADGFTLAEIDAGAAEILRIEGGRFRSGADFDESTLLLELDREDMVSFNKGCYLGQETVARVHSRGAVQWLLAGLVLDGDRAPAPGAAIVHAGARAGEVRSACLSPALERPVALARVRRTAADPGTVVRVTVDGRPVPATVRPVPLYRPPGPAEEAEALYRRGMEAYKADRTEEALGHFERATLMNPRHADAFEAAGVCLERLGRLGEAADIMQGLTEMDPENVMAWTNLSRYEAALGNIEEAEAIKGKVTYLIWKREMGKKEAEKREAQAEAARRAELTERVELFRRVLEADPGDVVANFGLGKILLDLERYEEAVPCFREAIRAQKDYSQAYNHLGACLLALDRREEAVEVLRAGVEAAGRKGDLIPKRDMIRKLEDLSASAS